MSVSEGAPVVFVIDDNPSVREALDSLLRSVNLAVLTFGSTGEFLSFERPDAPGCIVLDVRLPGQSGIDFQAEIARLNIDLPVIFITGHGDIAMSVRAIKAGAIEFLTKPFRDQDLLDAINIGIEKDRTRRKAAAMIAPLRSRFDSLTARARETMERVAAGRSNKQIATELGLSPVTVKVHRGNVMRKMDAKSIADLVRMAEQLRDPTQRA
jgi:FixJ family two-component response regulator